MRKNASVRLWFRANKSNLKNQKRANRSSFRTLICESLESRQLLAADIVQIPLASEAYSNEVPSEVSSDVPVGIEIRSILASSQPSLNGAVLPAHDQQFATWGLNEAEGEGETEPENGEPTATPSLTVVPLTVSIDQNTDLVEGIAVADLELTGLEETSFEFRLSGDQASHFEIRENKLYFISSTPLAELEQTDFQVSIQVWDSVTEDQLTNAYVFEMSVHSESGPTLLVGLRNTQTLEETDNSVVDFETAELYVENGQLQDFQVTLTGPDAEYFAVVDGRVVFNHPGPIDYENKSEFNLVIELISPSVNGGEPLSLEHRLLIVDVNEPPTSIGLIEPVESIPESTNVVSGIQVGIIDLQDDAIGEIEFSLAGPDAVHFYFDSGKLMFKSAEPLNAEVKSSYTVTIQAVDTTLEGAEVLTTDYVLTVGANQVVNLPPTSVALEVLVPKLVETLSIESVLLARVVIEDDGLGVNTITLPFEFSNRLEVIGDEIWIKGGAHWIGLDEELKIAVEVQDLTIENSSPTTVDLELDFIRRPRIAGLGELNTSAIQSDVNEIKIYWDEEVELDSNALQLLRTDVSGEIELVEISNELVDGMTVTTLKFAGAMAPNGVLANGAYTLFLADGGARSVENEVGSFSGANSFNVINESLLIEVEIDGPAVAFVGKATPFDFKLEGILEDQWSDVTLEIDWGVGNAPEIISPNQLELSRSHQFNQTGTFVIQTRLLFDGELLSEDRFVVHVSPAGSLQEDWLSSYDIDRDDSISPLDVLALVNFINQRESMDAEFPPIYDVNRDGVFSPTDILAIINTINTEEPGSSNGLLTEVEMDQSTIVPGFTSSPNITGRAQLDSKLLFASLNFSEPREITHLVQEDGSFSLSQEYIEELFGPLDDDVNTITLSVFDGRDFVYGIDKRFYVFSTDLADFNIQTAVVHESKLFLEWTSAGQARYSVIVTPSNGGQSQRFDNIANNRALIPIDAMSYDFVVEAVDAMGNVKLSQSITASGN